MILQASEEEGQSLNLIEGSGRQDQRLNWDASEAYLGGGKMEEDRKYGEQKRMKEEKR